MEKSGVYDRNGKQFRGYLQLLAFIELIPYPIRN